MGKLDINAHNLWHSGSNSIKVTFLDTSLQNFSNNVYFTWFCGGPHFPLFSIVFGNDIIMNSFLVTWLSNFRILWNFA